MKLSHIRLLLAFLGLSLASPIFASDPQSPVNRLNGLWSGADTNDPLPSAFLCVKLATNGQGAFISGGFVAVPGTFTYTLSQGRVDYKTNATVQLSGSLRYEIASDSLFYQAKPRRPSRASEPPGPVVLSRDADELKNALLGIVLGATDDKEVMARLNPILAKLRGATNYDDAVARLKPIIDAMTNRVGALPAKPLRPTEKPAGSGSTTNRQESPGTNR